MITVNGILNDFEISLINKNYNIEELNLIKEKLNNMYVVLSSQEDEDSQKKSLSGGKIKKYKIKRLNNNV